MIKKTMVVIELDETDIRNAIYEYALRHVEGTLPLASLEVFIGTKSAPVEPNAEVQFIVPDPAESEASDATQ